MSGNTSNSVNLSPRSIFSLSSSRVMMTMVKCTMLAKRLLSHRLPSRLGPRCPPGLADEQVTSATMRSLAAGLTSMVDVIDPKHGAVIYSQPFDEPPPQIIGDGVA